MERPSLTTLVLTYNEEVNLPHCLESVESLTRDIVVVDSGSDDATTDIAATYTDRVYDHPFENQAQQVNWVLDEVPIETDWVIWLAADEYLLPKLRAEIRETLPRLPSRVTGLYLKRRVHFLGQWIRHGGYYPTWLLRIFRTGKGRCEQREMDEHLVVLEGETRRLEHDFVDHNRKDLAFWTVKHERYAGREARSILKGSDEEVEASLFGSKPERKRWLKQNVYLRCPAFLRAVLYFLYRFFIRLGFLDGREGWVFHVLQAFWYRFYVDAKLMEMRSAQRDQPDG